MIEKKLHDELNKQINCELTSAYLYLSMANYCDAEGLPGFASWLKVQAEEELEHAFRIYEYLRDRGCKITLLEIAKPQGSFSSVEEVFELALETEKGLDKHFNYLANLALDKKDATTHNFLQWYLKEQVEEVALCTATLEKVRMAKNSGGLLFLDNALGQRKGD
jgi:ferritin